MRARLNRRAAISFGLAAGVACLPMAQAAEPGPAARRKSGNAVLGEGGIHHVTIRTRDWDRTLNFYRQALGFTVKMTWEERDGTLEQRLSGTGRHTQRWAYLDSGDGSCIEIFDDPAYVPPAAGATDPTSNPGSPIVHVALRTSRIDEVCRNARANGAVEVVSPVDFVFHPTSGQGAWPVRVAFLQGPSGEWIELLQNAP